MQIGTAARVVVLLLVALSSLTPVYGAGTRPAGFVENAGQWNAPARFQMTVGVTADDPPRRLDVWLTDAGYVYDLRQIPRSPAGTAAHAIALKFDGSRNPSIVPGRRLPGTLNWMTGSRNTTGAHAWEEVTYRGVYPGIDLTFAARAASGVETTWRVGPGADPAAIGLTIEGAARAAIDSAGNLVLSTRLGEITETRPVAFQNGAAGRRVPVPVAFELRGNNLRFRLGTYDRSRPLVIDPVVVFSRTFGGNSTESVADMHEDATGRYLTGVTTSADFPASIGAWDTARGGSQDWYAAKFDLDNDTLLWATFIGGSSGEYGGASDLAANGELVLTGTVQDPTNTGFPYVYSYGTGAGDYKVGLFRLSADGTSRVSAAIFGNSYSSIHAGDVEINQATGDVYVTGTMHAGSSGSVTSFPWGSGGFAAAYVAAFGFEPFVSRLSGDFSTYRNATMVPCWDNTENDGGMDLAFDTSNNVYVSGFAFYSAGATWRGTESIGPRGAYDLFVAKFSADLTTRHYGTVVGGSGGDPSANYSYMSVPDRYEQTAGNALAVDASGRAWVGGMTASSDWPATAGAFQTGNAGNYDGFIAALNATGSVLAYSTLVGGGSTDGIRAIAFDSLGRVYAAGFTASSDYPTTAGAPQTTLASASYDFFLSIFSPDLSQLIFSTLHGGTGEDIAHAVVVGPDATARVGGLVNAGFPQVPGGSSVFGAGGSYDGGIVSFNLAPDLAITKTAGTPDQSWLLRVDNHGFGTATFAAGQRILLDNLPEVAHGTPEVQNVVNVTNAAAILCSITAHDLTCVANGGAVAIPGGGSFEVLVSFTSSENEVTNPRTGGVVQVDPDGHAGDPATGDNTATTTTWARAYAIPLAGSSGFAVLALLLALGALVAIRRLTA